VVRLPFDATRTSTPSACTARAAVQPTNLRHGHQTVQMCLQNLGTATPAIRAVVVETAGDLPAQPGNNNRLGQLGRRQVQLWDRKPDERDGVRNSVAPRHQTARGGRQTRAPCPTDPRPVPPAYNGGFRGRLALLPGSPAIDGVVNLTRPPPSTDQRG